VIFLSTHRTPMSWESSIVGGSFGDGRYHVRAPLGAGGMAGVFLARDERLGGDVVVKIPHPHLVDVDPTFRPRFLAEMRALVAVSHPHIVKIIDSGECPAGPYAVLQYLPGGNLDDWLNRLRADRPDAVLWRELWRWLPPIADALDYMHDNGLVHRDVKPSNILFDADRRAYLSDFGLVHVVGESSSRLTQTGRVVGTPAYMAPEARCGLPLDGRSDQFSLALSVEQFLLPAIATADGRLRRPHLPSLPPSVSEVLRRGTATEPERRYRTCNEFAAALNDAWQPGSTASYLAEPVADGDGFPVCRTTPYMPVSIPADSSPASPASPAEPAAAAPKARGSVGLGTWISALVAVALAAAFAVWLNIPPGAADLIERDRSALLGRWRNESGLEMEFLPDGRLREKRLFDAGNGTYELLPDRKMRMRTEGMFGGALPTGGEGVLRYQLTDKELALTTDSGIGLTLRYQRVP